MMIPAASENGLRNAPTTSGGFVLVSTYSWLCIAIGVALVRYGQGLVVHKIDFGRDDATILVGTVIYLGATVSWQYAVNGGLGKDFKNLSVDETTLFFKATYIASLLGVFAMTFAKLSFAFLIERVAPQTRKANVILFGMTGVWTVYSTFAMSFKCGLPTWTIHSIQCNHGGVLISVMAVNILTDLALAVWLIPTFWSLAFSREKCVTATMLFGVRAVVPLVVGAQIWAVTKASSGSNPTRDAVPLVVLTQAVNSLSLILASVPRIKRFLGVGGSGILYPQIQPTEISLSRSRKSVSRLDSQTVEPKLVPSGPGRFTVTVTSSRSNNKKKNKPQSDWQGLVSMGTKEDEHTSTSSLFDREDQEGVMMQREVRVSVEHDRMRSNS